MGPGTYKLVTVGSGNNNAFAGSVKGWMNNVRLEKTFCMLFINSFLIISVLRNYFKKILLLFIFITLYIFVTAQVSVHPDLSFSNAEELNTKANGFRGIWYMNQPSNDEYVYKYSGGMATYTAKHQPFAIYSKKVNKTFFCFGGSDDENSSLFHNVSYFDHSTGLVSNPTTVLDKHTTDSHDNPVISIDKKGYIWIFSTSHGTSRPSYIRRSIRPYDINKFETISPTEIEDGKEVPFDNFSYFQVWYIKNKGFMACFTKYNEKGQRVIGFNTSGDGIKWKEWKVIAHIEEGHYQISGEYNGSVSVAFNYHPKGLELNYRTNLYYLRTSDFGESWKTADGKEISLPLTTIDNTALVKDFKSEGLNCYMKDMNFDKKGNPVIMVVSSKGYESGPENNPRTWEVFSYNSGWKNSKVTTSDNNYDTGSLYTESDGTWRIIGPTEKGPQAFNPGGEVAIWVSRDRGGSWQKVKQITANSVRNHTYVRRPLNPSPEFYAIWADGHGREPSESDIFFSDKEGNVFTLPRHTEDLMIRPIAYRIKSN